VAGFLGVKAPDSDGQLRDGRGAMTPMGNWIHLQQRNNATNKKGLSVEKMGWFPFPAVVLPAVALALGCAIVQFFWRVVLQLSSPILATVGVITLVQAWIGYLAPLILLNSDTMYPWPRSATS
jgi:hypothetical protein